MPVSRKFTVFVLAVALCTTAAVTGCREHRDHHDADSRESQPQPSTAASEDPHYRQWEAETHREHLAQERRSEAERREYQDWLHRHR